jgi:hypothetical protein
MKDFQDLDKTRLLSTKSTGFVAKATRIFSASYPFQSKENSATATISGTETVPAQIALAYSVHFGEKIANNPNNCVVEFLQSRGVGVRLKKSA